MKITQNNEKILYRPINHKVSHKRYSEDPEESPCFLVYLQSNQWPPLACHGRHHNIITDTKHVLQTNKSLSCHERYSVEEPNRLTFFSKNQYHVIF